MDLHKNEKKGEMISLQYLVAFIKKKKREEKNGRKGGGGGHVEARSVSISLKQLWNVSQD